MYFAVCYGCVVPFVISPCYGRSALCGLFSSYVLDRYWSSSRHLLCVHVFAVYYGCAALYMDVSYYVYRYGVLLIA